MFQFNCRRFNLTMAVILFFCLASTEDFNALALEGKPVDQAASMAQSDYLSEKWGIEIVGIRMSARGHMVDFRYRVVDASKSSSLFNRSIKPYLVDEVSGKVLAVPRTAKVGPLRSSNEPKEGKVYWMFFGNPGVVKTGSKVSVVMGDLKIENLIVQ